MEPNQISNQQPGPRGEEKLLASSGYSQKAIKYFIEKPYMGELPGADHTSEMLGSCGDTMKVYLKIDQNIITDARYEVLGCPGAISAAMAAVDLIKGKSLEFARGINDGDVFTLLEEIPAKKHHCIQLAVKALHKALDEYKSGEKTSGAREIECQHECSNPKSCCTKNRESLL